MLKNLTRTLMGMALMMFLSPGIGLAADPADVEKFVKSRIEIGEMMTNYFSGGNMFGQGRPSPDQMKHMREDINTKLGKLLATHDLTIEEYRQRSPEIFSDDAAVQGFLDQHPDLKERYQALPLDRMGPGGGRGYR